MDLENAWTAVLIADQEIVGSPASLFVPGGTLLERDAFLLVTSARSAREATTLLARLLNRSPIAPALSSGPAAEERALRALVREQRDIGCLDPLGPAPIIELLLRSRGESLALRRIMWSISLGAPSSQRVSLPQEAMR